MFPRGALARTSVVPNFRRVAGRRVCQRYQSTTSSQFSGTASSHFVAGLAGGGVVVVAGYAWYHFSGLKTAVQTSQQVKTYLTNARETVIASAKQNAGNAANALAHMRGIAKSYAVFIPGAGAYVDSTFDALDELQEEHAEEMNKIVKGASDELTKVVQEGGADAATASKVFEILRRRVGELQELGKKVGENVLDRNPKIKEKLGSGYDELRKLAESRGPEAKKILDDTTNQIKEMISKGSLSSESLENARQLLKDKSSQIQKIAMSAGAAGGASLTTGWEQLQDFVKSIPGGEDELKKMPHVKDFVEIANQRGDEAKELAKEAYQDILKVLEEKGQKAQKLTEKIKGDARGKSNDNTEDKQDKKKSE